jgi:hypothetical protein
MFTNGKLYIIISPFKIVGEGIMRKIVKLGSVGAGVLLVLAMLTTVVGSQTISTDEKKINVFQQIKEKIVNNWEPGPILGFIALILLTIYYLSIGAYWGF